MPARVIVLAGPSGAGKSHLARRLARHRGWPTLNLDDFYLDGDAEGLPRIHGGGNEGIVDWDDPRSWDHDGAVAALLELCRTGAVDVPVYSIPESRRTGQHRIELGAARVFCAEGIFAAEVVGDCRTAGMLAAAYCITQRPLVTFWRRLTRDLREHRKSTRVLLLRGLALARVQSRVVQRAVDAGCVVATGDEAFAELLEKERSGALAG